ncbi:MAG: hypothetical protein ISR46_06045 [Rhodospirillales bacterium]|nr:hypothetical protein [Rhodospirillales bacterium]
MSDLTINTSLQTRSSPLRSQSSSASATTVSAPKVDNVIKAGEYTAMKGTIDTDAAMYVVQFRDAETGAVHVQYPSKKAAVEYKKTAEVVESKSETPAPAPAPSTPQASGIDQADVKTTSGSDSSHS